MGVTIAAKTMDGTGPHEQLYAHLSITEPGYLYVYLSNENSTPVEVYFDDFDVKHTQSSIVAGADYYPYGLAMEGRKIEDEPYRYGYQGQFSEKDVTTGQQEFQLRNYDPRIGRWLTPDPYGQFASPYLAMGNLPHIRVDATGGWCCLEDELKAAAEKMGQTIETAYDGGWLRSVEITADRMTGAPRVPSNFTFNILGGISFQGDDGLFYATEPKMTGVRWYVFADGARQMFRDDGKEQERYAQQLLVVNRVLFDMAGALVSGGIGAGTEAEVFTESAGVDVTLDIAEEGTATLSSLKPTHYITKSENAMKKFVRQVKADGSINESIKYVEHNGTKYIVDGHHRYFAAQKLGLNQVPIQRVQLPFAGYGSSADFVMAGKQPGWWQYFKP